MRTSIANPSVQRVRARKKVANRPLHDYVNLFFNARNLMMYDVLGFETIPQRSMTFSLSSDSTLDSLTEKGR